MAPKAEKKPAEKKPAEDKKTPAAEETPAEKKPKAGKKLTKEAGAASLEPAGGFKSKSVSSSLSSSQAAYDVSLTDDGWSSDIFSIISGNTSTSWERLDAGALLSHSFELESKVKTVFHTSPAVITFRVPTKAVLQEAYSTPLLPLEILSDKPRESKLDLDKRALAKNGSLVSVISIVVLFVYLVATPSKSGAAKGSKKKR